MRELEKKITGDWADIKQAALNLHTLQEYFKLTNEELKTQYNRLKYSVEQGIIEYKRAILTPIFNILQDMKFRSIGFDVLKTHKRNLDAAIFVILIQRLFSSGILSLRRLKPEDKENQKDQEIKLIIADILARIKKNPELSKNPAVKMILTQVAIYQKELGTMKKLSPNIKNKKKAESFYKNFRETFKKIFESIHKNYQDLLLEETKKKHRDAKENILLHVSLKELVPFFTRQAREFARLMSTFAFTFKERYKTREILMHIYNRKEQILKKF